MIGRIEEQKWLKQYYASNKSEFIVVYGRRRIGKTYLIKNYFNGNLFFACSSTEFDTQKIQLEKWAESLHSNKKISNWSQAFKALKEKIEKSSVTEKKVIFIDEFPWFVDNNLQFMSYFDSFWNDFAAFRNDILLIVCGSAGNFIVNNIINATGGLHNRKTGIIKLDPFNLQETAELLRFNGLIYNQQDILEIFMILGGIPYYLDFLAPGLSVAQNIDRVLFAKSAPLRNEYNILFKSLFKNNDTYKLIIETIAKSYVGLSRQEIVNKTNILNNGYLTKILDNLENCNFIKRYSNYPNKKKEAVFQVIDNFCLFNQRIIEKEDINDDNFWSNVYKFPKYNSWRGYAFEQVCYQHIPQIKKALGISGIYTYVANWRVSKAQIDLLIERSDRIINLCEIKYLYSSYTINQKEYENLQNKMRIFNETTKVNTTIHNVLISPYGLNKNSYSNIIQADLTLKDLFN
ncbi:MAG: ATP-binding protein [Bacillales bacterium]|jgi:AAA+ ATPase superfamily predicted ATPase|nr:ATP-binding protein [Bacillales bacterium]